MKKKQIVSALLAAVLMTGSLSSVASAADLDSAITETVTPRYEIAGNPLSMITVNGTTITCRSSVSGDAVKISCVMTLEKYWGLWIWNEVENATWTNTVNLNNIDVRHYKYNAESGTYRLKTEFTLTDSKGVSETITIYSDEDTVS